MPVYALGEHEPQIHPDAFVMPEAVLIGRVFVGAEATIWSGAVLRGDDNEIHIGAGTSVQDNAVLHCAEDLATVVGERCTIGHLAHLEGATVHDEALIGTGAIVLHEAVVGARALVAAGALVPGGMVVPPGTIAVGMPAKIREDVDTDPLILSGVQNYLDRRVRFLAELRRLD
ncbi:MAG TPA: gamma carbonic anhydrase family protein [Acidimicrobiaceae bacterium]|nr:gamma carbonic anhydrase family protein [Acidimicrobiaceae bacterium]